MRSRSPQSSSKHFEGLITAEVEFDSVSDSEGFDPPPWFGDEITDDARYANQALAREGIPPEGG
jgi:adenylate cyclase